MGRSVPQLSEVVAALAKRGIGIKSLTEQIDTTTPGASLIGKQADVNTIYCTPGIARVTHYRSLDRAEGRQIAIRDREKTR